MANRVFSPSKLSVGSKAFWVILLILGLTIAFPENRAQAASITVNSIADTPTPGDTQCTLREAVANANSDSDTTGGDCVAGSGTDAIDFTGSVLGQTITLAGSQITLSSSMTIAASDIGVTLNGNNSSRVFQITVGSTVTLTSLRLTNGNVTGAGAGIQNLGTLTVNNSTLDANTATTFGGGILSSGSLTVNNTTIRNNSVASTGGAQAGGGGISNSGTMLLNNATISGNSVSGTATNRNGGGIRNTSGSTATLNNLTIVNNSTGSNGGGISDAGAYTMNNTIIANNTAGVSGPDCRGTVTANFTLIETILNCSITGGNNVFNSDPLLTLLDANGGGTISLPTLTHFPLDTSPALNAGNNVTCLATDERGNPRPVGTCDMGAVEKQTGEETDQHDVWAQGVPHTFGADVNVTITPNTTDNPGEITVLKRPVFAGLSQDSGEFQIVWTLTAEFSPYDLDIDFCYTDPELITAGVGDEDSIVIFHLENGVWQAMTTTTNAVTNCVTVSGVTSLSPWTIVGNGNAPTAIELQNLTARAVNSPRSMALALLAILGLALGVFLVRSRK